MSEIRRSVRAIPEAAMLGNGKGGGPLVWTTATGERIQITKMETSHLFNAMKMVFNHLAKMQGGQPVWFGHEYSDIAVAGICIPESMAGTVVLMIAELDTRKDLPEAYKKPLEDIRKQVEMNKTKQLGGQS